MRMRRGEDERQRILEKHQRSAVQN